MRRAPLLTAFASALLCASCAHPDQAATAIPSQFSDGNFFLSSIMQTHAAALPGRVTGITVPHHLLARDLIADTFALASGSAYDRVVILSPDHFFRGRTHITVADGDWRTPFGTLRTDTDAVRTLLRVADTGTGAFFSREHGIGAVTPYVKHFFPDARVVAIAIREDTPRAALDALLPALETLARDGKTLVVQSTDFSHYLAPAESRMRDQQTLSVLASGDPAALWTLSQPQNMDSIAAEYLQMRIQQDVFGVRPRVTANRNSQEYTTDDVAHTTSYITQVFQKDPAPLVASGTVVFGGDTFFGRGMTARLRDPEARNALVASILAGTGGAPLVVNLEGVVMETCPAHVTLWQLCMESDLSLRMLWDLHVVAVSLANNHAMDFGSGAYARMKDMLSAAHIRVLERGTVTDLGTLRIAAFTDVENNPAPRGGLLTGSDLSILQPGAKPLAVFVHWGTEYAAGPDGRQRALQGEMRKRGVMLIVGAHTHRASALDCDAGGCTAPSLGNLIFDQEGPTVSGALLRIRIFPQGTLAVEQVPVR
jgi:AmmeMemoRadiSam system protein B